MRVGFNARYLQKTPSGIEYYLLNLVNALTKIDADNEYFLFLNRRPFENSEMKDHLMGVGAKIYLSKWPSGSRLSRLVWDYAALKSDLKKKRIEILHGPAFSIPLVKVCPCVVTVHDLAFLYSPESYTRINRYYLKTMLPLVIKRADMIITVSESSKRDIARSYSVPDAKISVICPGIDRAFRVIDDPTALAEVKRKYGIAGRFILNVSGLITPRKNLTTLLKSFSELRRRKIIDHRLVIVGKPGWSYSQIFEMITRLNLSKDVIFTGSVPAEDLVALYNAAELFIFPSWYEGFGFPALEAMACGTPVVASNNSSLPEIVGDAGLLVDPSGKEALSEAIGNALGDKALREDLIRKGLIRARLFDWEQTALKTLSVYKQVTGDGR